MKPETYFVKVQRPRGVSVQEMSEYICDAVDSWRENWSPNNPLFNFELFSVKKATPAMLRAIKEIKIGKI